MNFDTVGARDADPTMADPAVIERLTAARNRLFETRFDVLSSLERGTMPPGDVGAAAFNAAEYAFVDGSPLPDITSSAGQEALRDWLACGAPMVERTADADAAHVAGEPCPEPDVGTCIVRGMGGPMIEPTWTSIYTSIIEPNCVLCHGPGPTRAPFVTESQLDLGTARLAYDSLVGVAAMGMTCGGMSPDRVIPNDPDGSFLIHKMENAGVGGAAICGGPMPTIPLPASQVNVIRQWIEDGALDN
jgi:hypothetical protein